MLRMKRQMVCLVVLAALLAMTFPVQAGAAGTGNIHGRVLDAKTNAPLAGIRVVCSYYVGGGAYSWGIYTYTDGEGRYEFNDLPVGEYLLQTSSTATHQDNFYPNNSSGPGANWSLAVNLPVQDGVTTMAGDFLLRPFGAITGTALNRKDGTPATGVTVQAYRNVGPGSWSAVSGGSTDASGTFRLGGLLKGDYRVVLTDPTPWVKNYYCALTYPDNYWIVADPSTGATITVPEDGDVVTLPAPAQMKRMGAVTANAVDWQSGEGVPGSYYTAYSPDGVTVQYHTWSIHPIGGTVTSLMPGFWQIRFVSLPGGYLDPQYYRDGALPTGHAALGSWFEVTDGESIEITGTLIPFSQVSGTVTHAQTSGGVAGVTVQAYIEAGGEWRPSGLETTTGSDGRWGFMNISAGTYRFRFIPPTDSGLLGSFFTAASQETSDVVVAPGEVVTGIDQPLAPDVAPPVTTLHAEPPVAVTGWSNAATVTVSLTATDGPAGTGVKSTSYLLSSQPGTQTYTSPIAITGEGVHTIAYWSLDNATNREDESTATIRIDRTAPSTTATIAASYVGPTTITLTAADALSGLQSTRWTLTRGSVVTTGTGTLVPVPAVGSYVLSYHSIDAAGNSEDAKTASFAVQKYPTSLTAPKPSTTSAYSPRRSAYVTVKGTATPASVNKGRIVINVYKYSTRTRRWVRQKTTFRAVRAGSTIYSARVRFTTAGKYRLSAYYPGDGLHLAKTSILSKTFTVR